MTLNSFKTGIILPGFALMTSAANAKDCHGNICHPVNEYCNSVFEKCMNCGDSGGICDEKSHNYHSETCATECSAYFMKMEITDIHNQQTIMLIILIILLVLILMRYSWKCCNWLGRKRCITQIFKKLQLRKQQSTKDKDINGLNATTIQNVMTINDIERAPSQIYSINGAEGSVMTMTTPVSTRYPAEDTTPTNVPTEYSYDNQALAVTPVSEKPNGVKVF